MPNTMKHPGKDDWGLSQSELNAAKKASPLIQKILPVIKTDQDYQAAIVILDLLMLEIRGHEQHELAPYLHILGTIVSEYEKVHFPIEGTEPIEIIKYLMAEHDLDQGELPEIGNQAKVSEVLSGKRSLNTRQIQALSNRFNVSPALFFPK
jgi:HTH-type transcriptional regulator/antitoxin HigA